MLPVYIITYLPLKVKLNKSVGRDAVAGSTMVFWKPYKNIAQKVFLQVG
jgi:hypothetical protein